MGVPDEHLSHLSGRGLRTAQRREAGQERAVCAGGVGALAAARPGVLAANLADPRVDVPALSRHRHRPVRHLQLPDAVDADDDHDHRGQSRRRAIVSVDRSHAGPGELRAGPGRIRVCIVERSPSEGHDAARPRHRAAPRACRRLRRRVSLLRFVAGRDAARSEQSVRRRTAAYLTFSLHQQEVEAGERSKNFRFGAVRPEAADQPEVFVLVVGESARRHNWSLYGYPRTPTRGWRKPTTSWSFAT